LANQDASEFLGGARMFIVETPDPAIRITHLSNTLGSSTPGSHAETTVGTASRSMRWNECAGAFS
jgi:acyl-CoA dehydrogenase